MKVLVFRVEARDKRNNVYGRITCLTEESKMAAVDEFLMGGAHTVRVYEVEEEI